jgi:hypothetical protein
LIRTYFESLKEILTKGVQRIGEYSSGREYIVLIKAGAGSVLFEGGGRGGPWGPSGFETKSRTPTAPKARARTDALKLRLCSKVVKAPT